AALRGVRGDLRDYLQLRRAEDQHRGPSDQLRRRADPRPLRCGRARRRHLLVQLSRRLGPYQRRRLRPHRRQQCRKSGRGQVLNWRIATLQFRPDPDLYCGGLTPFLETETRGAMNLPSPSTRAVAKMVSPGLRSAREPGSKPTTAVSGVTRIFCSPSLYLSVISLPPLACATDWRLALVILEFGSRSQFMWPEGA